MDYEKKYNEALEKAKKATRAGGDVALDIIQYIFPELRESEDERIRKILVAIIQEVKGNGYTTYYGESVDSILSYLEKQKELFESGRGLYYYDGEKITYCGYPATEENPYDFAMSQQEKKQKPVDYEAELKKCKDNPLYFYDKYVSIKQKSVEWSKEDEKKLRLTTALLQSSKEKCMAAFYKDVDESVAWLQSLRPQPQGTYKQVIHTIFGMLKDKDFYEIQPSHRVSLLNDIRVKCKDAIDCAPILDEPHWRPSEEHLSALLAIFNDPNNLDSQTCQLALTDLYEQLKKLM